MIIWWVDLYWIYNQWRGVLDTTLCDKVCQWLATCRCCSPGIPVSSTNKTDRYTAKTKPNQTHIFFSKERIQWCHNSYKILYKIGFGNKLKLAYTNPSPYRCFCSFDIIIVCPFVLVSVFFRRFTASGFLFSVFCDVRLHVTTLFSSNIFLIVYHTFVHQILGVFFFFFHYIFFHIFIRILLKIPKG